MRDWKVKNGIKTVEESSIPPHVLLIVRDLCNQIDSDADDKITEHKETLDRKLSDTKLLLETSKSQNEIITTERDQLKADLAHSENSNRELQSAIDDAQKKQIASNERITAIESHNTEYKNEISRLHQLLKEAQTQTSQLNETLDRERKIQSDLTNSLRKDHEEKITTIQTALNQSQIENTKLKSDIVHASKLNTKLENEFSSLKESHQLILKNHDELQKETVALKNQLDNEKLNNSALAEKIENKNNENINLTIQLKTNEHIIAQSDKMIAKLENEITLLHDKNETLMRDKYQLEIKIGQIKLTEEIK